MSDQSFGKVYFLYDFIEKYIFKEYLHEINIIKNNIDLKKNQNIVDIGGGTGYIARSIINNVNSVTIVDFSKKMLQQLKNPTIKVLQGDASLLPIKDGVFDIALLINVLHHIEKTNQNSVIKETFRILKKDGKIFILDLFYPNKFFNILFNKFEEIATGKTYHISCDEVVSKLNDVGFHDVSSSFQDWRDLKYLIVGKK